MQVLRGILLLSIIAWIPSAVGALVSQTERFGPMTTSFNVADPLSFERFDPTLGTLAAVTISIRATLSTSGTVTNLTAEPVDLRIGGFSTAVVVLPFGLPQVSLGPAYALEFTDFGPGETRSIDGTNTRGSVNGFTDSATLAQFTGTEEFFLPQIRGNSGAFWNPVGMQVSQTGQISYEIVTAYTYTPVPEPSVALLGIASMGVLLSARRRPRAPV